MTTMRSAVKLLSFLAIAVLLAGCLRYVPSRRELSAGGENSIAGPDQFWAYEKMLSQRLQGLVQQRAKLVHAGDDAYRLGPGDILDLQVYSLPELNTTAEIAPDGTYTTALLGPVKAQGLTLPQFRDQMAAQLGSYVRNPRVVMSIKQYANRVSVTGEVAKPGVYPLKREGATLTEVLSLAGGRNERAGTRIIVIPAGPRAADASGAAEAGYGVEIDSSELAGTVSKRPVWVPLLPGDTVVVPEAGAYKVDGEVLKAGSFPLNGRTSALGAIAAAGGFTYSANVNEVEVIRDIGGGDKASVVLDLEKVALNGGQDVQLRDGDVVRVPSAAGRFSTRQIVEVINGVFRGGVSGSVRYQ